MKRTPSSALSVFLLSFVLLSCTQDTGTATMRILLYQEEKTISVSENAYDIQKYTVTGSGPGGAVFTADSPGTSLVLEGLQVGNWTVSAKGYNKEGKAVSSGETRAVFSSDKGTVSVPMIRVSGTGKLELVFKWDSSISKPKVRVSLFFPDGTDAGMYDADFSSNAGTSGTFRLTNLESGFYILKCELFSSSVRLTGTVEALQISGSETTSGTVSFASASDYDKNLTELYMPRSGQSAVRGRLSSSPSEIPSGENFSVSLTLSGSSVSDSGAYIKWYLDGTECSSGRTVTVKPSPGWHIVNALLVCPNEKSAGSLSWKFFSKPEGLKGTVVCVSEADSSSVVSDASSFTGAAGDSRFLILTPDRGILQVVKIYNNTLVRESVYRDTDDGFSWLRLSNGLYSAAGMKEFAVTDSNNCIHLLYLDDGKVKKCTRNTEEVYFEGTVSAFSETIVSVSPAWIDPSNSIMGFACFKDAFLLLEFKDGILKMQRRQPKPIGKQDIIMVSSFGNTAVCASSDGVFYSCAFRDGRFYGVWKESGAGLVFRDPARLTKNGGVVFPSSAGLLEMWCAGDSRWGKKSESDVSPLYTDASSDGCFLYACESSGRLTTYSISDSGMSKIGKLDTSYVLSTMAVGESAVLGMKRDGKFVIISIAGE